jgi:hypothetical protein
MVDIFRWDVFVSVELPWYEFFWPLTNKLYSFLVFSLSFRNIYSALKGSFHPVILS